MNAIFWVVIVSGGGAFLLVQGLHLTKYGSKAGWIICGVALFLLGIMTGATISGSLIGWTDR